MTGPYRSLCRGIKSSPKTQAAVFVAMQQSAAPLLTCHASLQMPGGGFLVASDDAGGDAGLPQVHIQ
jgi:hypothetical protein